MKSKIFLADFLGHILTCTFPGNSKRKTTQITFSDESKTNEQGNLQCTMQLYARIHIGQGSKRQKVLTHLSQSSTPSR